MRTIGSSRRCKRSARRTLRFSLPFSVHRSGKSLPLSGAARLGNTSKTGGRIPLTLRTALRLTFQDAWEDGLATRAGEGFVHRDPPTFVTSENKFPKRSACLILIFLIVGQGKVRRADRALLMTVQVVCKADPTGTALHFNALFRRKGNNQAAGVARPRRTQMICVGRLADRVCRTNETISNGQDRNDGEAVHGDPGQVPPCGPLAFHDPGVRMTELDRSSRGARSGSGSCTQFSARRVSYHLSLVTVQWASRW